jgi:FlaG/FlaF family flagellin (archaellin)
VWTISHSKVTFTYIHLDNHQTVEVVAQDTGINPVGGRQSITIDENSLFKHSSFSK